MKRFPASGYAISVPPTTKGLVGAMDVTVVVPLPQVDLLLRNLARYYIANTFVPSIMLATIACLTFCFDLNDFTVSGHLLPCISLRMAAGERCFE